MNTKKWISMEFRERDGLQKRAYLKRKYPFIGGLASEVGTKKEGSEQVFGELRRMGALEILHMQIPCGHCHTVVWWKGVDPNIQVNSFLVIKSPY